MTFNHDIKEGTANFDTPPELVIVVWEDTAALEETWSDKEEAVELEPGIMHSVGWVLTKHPNTSQSPPPLSSTGISSEMSIAYH